MSDVDEVIEPDEGDDAEQEGEYRPTRGVLSQEDYQGDTSEDE